MLTAKQYADQKGINVREVYRMIDEGKLETKKVPKTVIKREVTMIVGEVKNNA